MISIINYGSGNIQAFANAYRKLNVEHQIISNIKEFNNTTKIILPGVGSFDSTMKSLLNSGMKDKLDELVLEKKIPVVGICVGMQILAKSSEEGTMDGLGWIDGTVKKIKSNEILPHMGWNNLDILKKHGILKNINLKSRFYFLHSYYLDCKNRNDIIAETEYGIKIPGIINFNNIYGIQCHPEKSHLDGIQFLNNFKDL